MSEGEWVDYDEKVSHSPSTPLGSGRLTAFLVNATSWCLQRGGRMDQGMS
jgi:hypothetical protein